MRAAVFAVVLLLAGCGFHLQGRRAMPPALSILKLEVVDEQSDFTRALRAALKSSGSRLVATGTADGATVRIRRDEFTERVLSVDARNIPTDIELIYRVEVEVHADGKELMAVKPFELSRSVSDNERRHLAKEQEKDILRKDLAREMASLVTRVLSEL